MLNSQSTFSKYRVLVSEVKGNTATYGEYASFHIYLTSKPDSNVTIHIESSNENEGIPGKRWSKDIIITPENWKFGKRVLIQGTNKNVIKGKQNYKIITFPAVSDDLHFNGINPDDIVMLGEYLKIEEPDDKMLFISGIDKQIQINVEYNGYRTQDIKLNLKESPNTMRIEEFKLLWTPTDRDIGKIYVVKLEVTDGVQHSEKLLEVKVAKPYPLKQKKEGHTITIIEKESILNGISIEILDKSMDISGLKIMTLDKNDMAQILSIRKNCISKIFMLNKFFNTEMKLRIPISSISKEKDITSVDMVGLDNTDNYHMEILEGGEIPNEMWVGLSSYRKFKKYLNKDVIEFPFGGIRPFYISADDKE